MLPRAGEDAGTRLPSTGRPPGVSSPPRQSGGLSPPRQSRGLESPRQSPRLSGGSSPSGRPEDQKVPTGGRFRMWS
uniref:Uncharacterized protein n=1 Tax=Mustela putorius furo TaxID=9669 RepID=M3XPW0_MUSPF